jgi:hypothetical protein
VNVADIALGLALGLILVGGLLKGLSGLVLITAASILSLVAAGAAAFLTAQTAGIPRGGLYLLVPCAFFVTLFLGGYFLRSFATHMTRFVHRLPFASIDRLLGAAVAGGLGIVILSLLVFGALSLPVDNPVTSEVRAGEAPPILLNWSARAIGYLARPLPVFSPLAERLEAAGDALGRSQGSPEEV